MKARIRQNRFGNWYGYLGTRRVAAFGNSTTETAEQAAARWLREQTEGKVVVGRNDGTGPRVRFATVAAAEAYLGGLPNQQDVVAGAYFIDAPEELVNPPAAADFDVENHGSIFILQPLTPAAREWVSEHIADDAQWWAGGVVVEHRYIADIVEGALSDGLVVR